MSGIEQRGPTGRRRHRVQRRWFRSPVLVLQIEYRGRHWEWLGGYIDCTDFIAWRDARPEDVTVEP